MSPIPLGILAASGAGDAGAFEQIATTLATTSSITFSSIPQTYKHLQIRWTMRGATTSSPYLALRVNGNANIIYVNYGMAGNGGIIQLTNSGGTQSSIAISGGPNSSISAGAFSTGIIDISNYNSTINNKTLRSFSGMHNESEREVRLLGGLIILTNAITSIELFSGSNYASGTRFSLYGIKG